MRTNKKYFLTYKMQKYKAEKRLKQNAMNIITGNLHCNCAVGRERATLCRFITQDVFLLTSMVKLKTAACTRILKNMQIVLNARERNTKHILVGTLMNQNKIPKVPNSTTLNYSLCSKSGPRTRNQEFNPGPGS